MRSPSEREFRAYVARVAGLERVDRGVDVGELTVGQADLHALLLARRQATGAAQSALASKFAALKTYSLLLVDAHLIWGLDHD